MASSLVTRSVLEGYLNCKYLAHLRLSGREGIPSDYEQAIFDVRRVRCSEITDTLLARHAGQSVVGVNVTRAELSKGTPFIFTADLCDDVFRVRFDGLKRVDGYSDLGPFHYVPMLLSESHNVHRWHRLLLASLGMLLGRVQKRPPARGVIYHREPCEATSVAFGKAARTGEDILQALTHMARSAAAPQLQLNDHCSVCEFRLECRSQAIESDSLSLLRGLRDKELKRYARRGIFTLGQLSHTFRPRRPGKRARPARLRQYALQALAIRDGTVYVFGAPDLPARSTEIYLDVESKPDEQFVYLIGLVVRRGDHEKRYSFWADRKEQERLIFDQMLAVVAQHADAHVYSYGAYERAFIKRMRTGSRNKKLVDVILGRLVNALSIVYNHFYFPTYSNGLKDIAAVLGYRWSHEQASGIQSIAWRIRWERSLEEGSKERLLQYNLEDCAALAATVAFMRAVTSSQGDQVFPRAEETSGLRITPVEELDKARYVLPWTKFINPDMAFVNKRAYFDYQRQRVYVRGNKPLLRRYRARDESRNRKLRSSKSVQITAKKCSACQTADLEPVAKPALHMGMLTRRKRVLDLQITESGIKRKVTDYRTTMYQCRSCGHYFTPERYHRLARHSHAVMSWVTYQAVVHRLSIGTIQDMSRDLFGVSLHPSDIIMFRSLMARHYRPTYRSLLTRLTSGRLLHADETEVTLRTGKGYVWVFASIEDAVYFYRPNREGAFLRTMLKGFSGVLVSDFYAPYDALECPQQKCLIHLIRDMNQDVIAYPYDAEVQAITGSFGALLRAIIDTIDEHGLKRRKLLTHAASVAEFFSGLSARSLSSEPARALQARLLKNRYRLFTFIEHNDVPWNNNSAENAIKRFSYFRDETAPQMKEQGLHDYLVLLSIFQSCRYKGVSFWKFLLSKQKDIDAFASGARLSRHRGVELYPSGFQPPHLAAVRKLGKSPTKPRTHER